MSTENRDNAEYPPLGELVELDGYRLHLYVTGKGTPTVVMLSGVGNDCLVWQLVQPTVAEFCRVCTYDRAGLGWSDMTDNPRTSAFIANELHHLLQHGNIEGPYVMVGHSMGGIYAREYARQYPDEVVGMVLVDSPHEELNLRSSPRAIDAEKAQVEAILIKLLQSERLELSSNSRQIMVENSGHFIQQEQPALVIDAIREVVDAVQSNVEYYDVVEESGIQP